MKNSILISLASLIGLTTYAQTGPDKIADNTVIIMVNNNDNVEKEKKEKAEKEEKEKKEKKDKENSGPVTGLEEMNALSMVSVYPNPASDQLFISNVPSNATTYIITNMEGTEVSRGSVNNSQMGLNVKNFNGGVYSIQLLDNNQALLYKNRIIINN